MGKLALLIYHGTRSPRCRLLLDRLIKHVEGKVEDLKVEAVTIRELPSRLQRVPLEGVEVHTYTLLLTPGTHYHRDVMPHILSASKRLKLIDHGLVPEWVIVEALRRAVGSESITLTLVSKPSREVEERLKRIEAEASKRLKVKVEAVASEDLKRCRSGVVMTLCPSTLAERAPSQVKRLALIEEAEDLLAKWVIEGLRKRY